MTTEAPAKPTVQGLLLHRAFRNAIPFAAPSNDIPSLNAVRLSAADDVLTIDATDRYKLLRQTVPAPGVAFDPVVVSLSDFQTLTKQIDGAVRQVVPKRIRDKVDVTITSASDLVRIEVEAYSLAVPVLDLQGASYPQLDRLLIDYEAQADTIGMRSEHLAAFGVVKLGADDRHGYVDWRFTANGREPTRWTAIDEASGHTLEALLMPVNLGGDR